MSDGEKSREELARENDDLKRRIRSLTEAGERHIREEKKLQERLYLSQQLIDNIPTPIFFKDTGGIYTGCNVAFENYIGLPREKIVGKSVYDVAPKELADIYHKADEEVLASKGTQVYETKVRYADGSLRDVIFYKAAMFSPDGSMGGMVGAIFDITKRKEMETELEKARAELKQRVEERTAELEQANKNLSEENRIRKKVENALRRSERRLSDIIGSSPIPQFAIDRNHKVIFWNKALEKYSGIKSEDIVGTDLHWRAFYSNKRPCMADLLVDGKEEEIPVWYRGKYSKSVLIEGAYEGTDFFPDLGENGTWLHFTSKAIQGPENRIIAAIETLQDVTEGKLAEEALMQSRRQLSEIIDHLPDATLAIDRERKIIAWNKAMEEMTGVKASEVLGKGDYEYAVPFYGERRPMLIDLTFEEDRVIEKWQYTNIKREGPAIMAETALPKPRKKSVVIWAKATPLYDKNGKQIGAIESVRDITELRQAEAVLRESEEKFRVLAETSPAGIFLYQGDRFIYVNPAAEKISGYSKEELLTMRYWDWIHPDFRELVRERGYARQLSMQVPAQYEFKYVAKSGHEGWALLSAGKIVFRGKPAGIGTIFDITERKKAEEELEEAKNRAELYVDLMSHDIRNLNHAIMGYLELALNALELKKDEKELLSRAIELAGDSSKLIDKVKEIQNVRTGAVPATRMDAGEVLGRTIAKFSESLDERVRIHYSPSAGYMIMGNNYLGDAFWNILENSVRHSAGPLEINVGIGEVREDTRHFYRITFEDNGPGIPDAQKNYMFMDLSMEKVKTRRIGLGLQLVKAVIESLDGKVWVEDRIPGDYKKGCRFVITLPAV